MMKRRPPSEVRRLLCEGRWQRKHLLSLQKKFGDAFLFDVLFGVFTEPSEPVQHYHNQEVCGRYLCALRPPCHLPLKVALRDSLPRWNLSVEQLPWYLWQVFGREAVLQALQEIEAEDSLSEAHRTGITTCRYWLRADKGMALPPGGS